MFFKVSEQSIDFIIWYEQLCEIAKLHKISIINNHDWFKDFNRDEVAYRAFRIYFKNILEVSEDIIFKKNTEKKVEPKIGKEASDFMDSLPSRQLRNSADKQFKVTNVSTKIKFFIVISRCCHY